MSSLQDFEEFLAIGIVQTTTDAQQAWPNDNGEPKMSAAQDDYAWQEICKAMRSFKDGEVAPKFVVFPELALPRTRLEDFSKIVCSLNVIAFVGVDYLLDRDSRQARNQGMVFIPNGFWKGLRSRNCTQVIFGKSHPAPGERKALEGLDPPWSCAGDDKVYVFDADKFGRIGVSICYDFMDLERAVMYRGKIHHLLVIAYNKDLGMFKSLADSLSRTVYCNVVVCNTGAYGGSVAVSPFHLAHRRTIYAHTGNQLFTTQVVKLPIRGVEQAVQGDCGAISYGARQEKIFKDPPPGMEPHSTLVMETEPLNSAKRS